MAIYIVAAPGNANSGASSALALVDGLVIELPEADVETWSAAGESLVVSAAVYDQLRERLSVPPVPSEVEDDDVPPRMTAPPS